MKKYIIFALLILSPFLTQARFLEKYDDWKNVPEWSNQALEALLQSGIISGNDDGTIRPGRTINRAEFCKILVNATKKKFTKSLGRKFPDVNTGDWFYPFVEIAHAEGWIDGYPDGKFKPGAPINRAEIAKLLTKAFKFQKADIKNPPYWYLPFVKTLDNNGLLPYQILTKNFSPARTPTRAEVFEQLYRSVRVYRSIVKPKTQIKTVTTKIEKMTDPFSIEGNFTIKMAVTDNAGTLKMKKPDELPRKKEVKANNKNITAFQLEMLAEKYDVEMSEIQFRRIGYGFINEFRTVWLEVNGFPITGKFKPTKDLIIFKLKKPLKLKVNQLQVLTLKTDISDKAKIGHSHRFVLYLPNWLNANTNEKIGFFPFGGTDIMIK